jgi:hypothetical protein
MRMRATRKPVDAVAGELLVREPPGRRALASRAASCLLVVALGIGCATRGRHFDVDSVDRIRPAVTTQEDCRRWFGEPTSVSQNARGQVGWGYEVEETKTRSTRTITKIVSSISRLFGWWWWWPPLDVEYEESTRHSLEVVFYPDGTVADYMYEREVTPSKRVY